MMSPLTSRLTVCLLTLWVASVSSTAFAGAIRGNAGFNTNTMHLNDDGSEGPIPLGSEYNFFGLLFTELYVNTNGNVTLDVDLDEFTPSDITSLGQNIIAPFWADVDIREAGDPVRYGADTVDGHAAFGVNWLNVDYYDSSIEHTNRNFFQLVLIDRTDTGAGNFDIEFNYDQIQWEAGEASGSDENGLGGYSARVGFSNGTGDPGTFFELYGSAINGAFLDGGPQALISHRFNSDVDGRYLFNVRNGAIEELPPSPIPEPSTIAMLLTGAVGLIGYARRRKNQLAA